MIRLAIPTYAAPNYAIPDYALAGYPMGAPYAPDILVATTIDHQSVGLTWVDNSEDVAGLNEIQHITFDDVPEAGTFTLTFDGETTAPIAYNADAATVQASLEAIASFEVGDVSVTTITGGYAIEFTGGLAAMNVDPITADSSLTRMVDADTINVTVVQSGIADAATVPSISTTTTAVAPVNEVQQVDIGGATTGAFDLNGNSTSAEVSTLDTAGIQDACDTIWGSGNTTVESLGGDLFSVTFGGSFAATNVGQMSVSNNSTDGSPVVTTTTQGVAGVHQVDTITFSPVPASGVWGMDANPNELNWNDSATTIAEYYDNGWMGRTFTGGGSIASGSVTITHDDYESRSPRTINQGTLISASGRHDITTITLGDNPTEGTFTLTQGGNDTVALDFNATTGEVDAAVTNMTGGFACTVTGSAGNWTIESNANRGPVDWSASESTPLRKSAGVNITVSTDTQGSPQEWAEIGFYLQRSPDGSTNWTQIVDLGANLESWDDTGLEAETEYFYRIAAYNAGGQSSWSSTDSATTDAAPTSFYTYLVRMLTGAG